MPGATTRVPSTIDRVTVHRRDAVVRRIADVGGFALPSTARIAPLPLTLHPASVRAVLMQPDGAAVTGAAAVARVAVEPVGGTPSDASAPEREVEAARRALDLAAAEVDRLRLDLDAIESWLEPVERERVVARDGELRTPADAVPVERRLALLALRTQQTELLAPALLAAERTQREAERTLREATDRLSAVHRQEGREHELVAAVEVAMQGRGSLPAGARLEVSYLVAGATWRPSHRLFVDGERSRVRLGAVVTQRTGEDWADVELELATREPSRRWELPELKPLRIGRATPQGVRGWRPPEPLPTALFADFDRARRAAEEQERRRAAATASSGEPELLGQGPITGEVPRVPEPSDQSYGAMGASTSGPMPLPALPVQAPPPVMPPEPPPGLVAQAMPVAARSAESGPPRSRAWRAGAPGASGAPPPAPAAMAAAGGAAFAGGSSAPMVSPPERPDPAVADLDALVLPAATDGDRGRPRPRATGPDETARLAGRTRARALHELERDAALGSALGPPAMPETVSCVYGVPAGVTLASARDPVTVMVDEAPTTVEAGYVTVPSQSTEVFRTLVITNPFSLPIVAGPLEVTGPAGYVGPADLPTVTPRATVRVGMGVEEGIRVERQVDHRDDAKGLVRSSRVLEHDIRVRLTNRLTEDVTVEVRERIPTVPDTEDRVTVEELAVDPPWQEYTRSDAILRGGRRWSVDVPASSTAHLHARWQIVIPAKFELDGGNRR